MSKQTEAQRIAKLESIRNGENTELINQAILQNKTAEEVAHSILSDRSISQGGHNFSNSETIDMIVNAANDHPGRQPKGQSREAGTANESNVDMIAAAINNNRGTRTI